MRLRFEFQLPSTIKSAGKLVHCLRAIYYIVIDGSAPPVLQQAVASDAVLRARQMQVWSCSLIPESTLVSPLFFTAD